MSNRRTAHPFLAQIGQSVAIQLVIGAVSFCIMFCVVILFVWLATQAADNQNTMIVLILCATFFIAVIVASTFAVIFLVPMIRNRKVDEYFTPLGLTGSSFAFQFRRYTGIYQGIEVEAKYYRGVNIDLFLKNPLNTRMGLGTRTGLGVALSGLINAKEIKLTDPAFAELAASGHDEQWVRGLLSSEAREPLLRLLQRVYATEGRNFIVEPGGIRLMIYHTRMALLNAENVRTWFNDLLTVLKAAQELPPARAD